MSDADLERPEPALIADLLRERYEVDPRIRLGVEHGGAGRNPALAVKAERLDQGDVYELRVQLESGDGDPMTLVLDATDALFGSLLESDFAYRSMPAGEGVSHEGASFSVSIERRRPEVDRQADQLLRTDPS